MATLKLSSPWVVFYREISELFRYDPDVVVIFNEDENEVRLYVDSYTKSTALMTLLPTVKTFGNVTLKITVFPPNEDDEDAPIMNETLKGAEDWPTEDVYDFAFSGNAIFNYVRVVKNVLPNDIVYVVFQKEVVQYFNDDLGDAHGICSTLYQDIADRVLNKLPGVHFCTDIYDEEVMQLVETEDGCELIKESPDEYWP